jgi:hypothetical protein
MENAEAGLVENYTKASFCLAKKEHKFDFYQCTVYNIPNDLRMVANEI